MKLTQFALSAFAVVFLSLGASTISTAKTGSPNETSSITEPYQSKTVFKGTYISLADAETKPYATFLEPPAYPSKFRRLGIEGAIELQFIINSQGRAVQIQCSAATDIAFAKSGIAALKKSRWVPATVNGEPTNCLVKQKFHFSPD